MKTAFLGQQEIKDAVLQRLREHRRLDEIVQGTYWEEGRGCHLGCLTHDNDTSHQTATHLFGIPTRVTYWLEGVFENLPKDECAEWVIESTNAIPVGADLSLSHHHLAVWLLGSDSPGGKGNSNVMVADKVAAVRELHQRVVIGDIPTEGEWSAAWSAARSAWSAAWSAWSAAESAAESAAWQTIAAKSIEILQAAPVKACDECDTETHQAKLNLGLILEPAT